MPGIGSRAATALFRLLQVDKPFRTAEAAEAMLRKASLRPASYGPPKRYRNDVELEIDFVEGWPVYTVVPSGTAPSRCCFYIHGGGYVAEMNRFDWSLVGKIAVEADVAVKVPIYPSLPHGCAEEVVGKVARLLVSHAGLEGADNISIVGGSAGGQISLSALQIARDAGHAFRRAVLIHPAVDLSASNPDLLRVEQLDPCLRIAGIGAMAARWRRQLPIDDPRVSPLRGEMAGLGPMTILSGTYDITNPDTRLLVKKAREAGVEIDYHEGEGIIHPSVMLPTREGREARNLIVSAVAS